MEYTRDSLGAPVEPMEEEPVCVDFKGDEIYENEEICIYRFMDGSEKVYRPDDQDEFIKTLPFDELQELVLSLDYRKFREIAEVKFPDYA